MTQSELDYYRRRAEQEAHFVRHAANNVAAAVHGELAAAYTARLAEMNDRDEGTRHRD